MFNWRPQDRLRVIDQGHALAANYDRVSLLIPVYGAGSTNYDPFTDSPSDGTSVATSQTGKVISSWKALQVVARVGTPKLFQFNFPNMEVGWTEGTLLMYVNQRDVPNVQQVIDSDDAYCLYAGDVYRPFTLTDVGIFHDDEECFRLDKVTTRVRATGY